MTQLDRIVDRARNARADVTIAARERAYIARRRLRRVNLMLVATLLGAVASFGLCFVVVADAMRSSAPTRAAEPVANDAARVKVALADAPALKVNASVLAAPVQPVRSSAASRVAPTTSSDTETDTTQQQQQQQQQEQQQQATTEQPTRQVAKPKPKPKPTPKPTPKGPDFDDAGPQGP